MRLAHRFAALGLGLGIAFGIADGAAATVSITNYSFSNGSEAAKITDGSSVIPNASIGQFTLDVVNDAGLAQVWNSFCVDLADTLQKSGGYTLSTLTTTSQLMNNYTITQAKIDQLKALLSQAPTYITNAETSAAMQMAVWEIEYETGTTGYDVTLGNLKIGNRTDGNGNAIADAGLMQAITDANFLLGNLGGYAASAGNVQLSVLTQSGKQTQLLYSFVQSVMGTVPEPETWMMMILGFGFIGAALRRRRDDGLPSLG